MNIKMSDILSNTYLTNIVAYVKPEQSGKTFEMIESIITQRKNNIDSNIIPIDIIITDLNISLVNQTIDRVKEKLYFSEDEDHYLKDLFEKHRFISFNSKDKKYKNMTAVLSEIRDDYDYLLNDDSDSDSDSELNTNNREGKKNGTIISCCRHEQRWKDLFGDNNMKKSIIYKLYKISKSNSTKFKFTIWCDEFDVYIKNIEKYIKPFMNKNTIDISVNGLSATIENVYKKYDTFKIKPFERTYIQELYHNWDDNKIFEEEAKMDIFDFVTFILDKYYDETNYGSKWFIPAKNNVKSHENICKICLSKGMCVFIKNANGLKLYIPGKSPIKLNETSKKKDGSNYSFSELFVKAIKDYKLNKYQFAVSGFQCVGRGITIQSNEFYLIMLYCMIFLMSLYYLKWVVD